MNTYQMPQTLDSVGDEPLDSLQLAYFSQRFRAQVYYAIAEAFRSEVEAGRVSQAALSRRLDKDPSIISRWFSGPKNLELDTVSEMLLALGAEPRLNVHFFRDNRSAPNDAHPLINELSATLFSDTYALPVEQEIEEVPPSATSASNPTAVVREPLYAMADAVP